MRASSGSVAVDQSMVADVSAARASFASGAAGSSQEICGQRACPMEDCKLVGGEVAMEFSDRFVRARKRSRVRTSLVNSVATFCFISLLHSFLFAATEQGPRSAFIRTGEFPGVRFNSGLTVCDEELRKGRWVTRYWDSSGQIIADIQIDAERDQIDTLPVDAFKLEIEGQELSGTWKWIGAEKSEVHNPDGLLVTVELESGVRPIHVLG